VPKNVFIPWSGGFDSTYLIYKTLTEGHRVWSAYVNIQNERPTGEKVAQENLAPMFQANFGKRFTELGEVGSVAMNCISSQIAMAKAPVVFPLLVHALPRFLDDKLDEVAIAFNATDKFRAPFPLMEGYELKVKALWESCRDLIHGAQWEVVFPLLHLPKSEVKALLPEEYRQFCWGSPQRLVTSPDNAEARTLTRRDFLKGRFQ
jgi:hypothetical protein